MTPYFAPALQYGGPPASVLGLCKGLQRSGVDVQVLTTTANGHAPLRASPPGGEYYEGVPVRYVTAAFPRRFFGARIRGPLEAALAHVDVCHIHGVWNVPEWWASRLARAHDVPYVVSPRGMLQPQAVRHSRWRKTVAYRLFERTNLRSAALLHATSAQEADALRDLDLGVPVVVVPNGVDLDAAQQAARGYRRHIDIPSDAFIVLFLGRMHRIKRLDLLAGAFAEVRATHPSVHLVLAGHDEHRLLPGLLRELSPHEGFVHALDAVSGADKWALLRDADVSVQCSDSESFGLAVVESLAAGTPAIATRTCPWRDVETRECGFWVEQTAPAIAAAIRTLVDDPSRRRQMGERGAAFARACYGWDAIAPVMANLYSEAVQRGTYHA